MLSRQDIINTLSLISCGHYKIVLHEKGAAWSDHDAGKQGPMFFIQVQFFAQDHTKLFSTQELVLQKCRWWLIDTDKGPSEVIRTAYKAVEAAVLHELGESFKYAGKAIMDPHRDLVS